MSEKSEAIIEAKRVEEQIKQEQAREAKEEEKKQEAQAEAKKEEKKEEFAEKPPEKNQLEKKQVVEKKEEKKVEEKKAEKKFVLERVYGVPLRKAFRKPRSHRARVAVSLLKQFAARHAKASGIESVVIDSRVNSLILERGARNPPKLVRVLIQKDESGKVFVALPGK